MANTYSKIYIQIILVVKRRKMLIDASWEDELYKYITGIITHKGQKLLAINGMPDHTHILIGMKPTCCLSNLVMEVKKSTNGFINDNRLSKEKFYWQAGFSAFSYSHGALNNIIRYIENQKDHHKKKLFMKEYLEFLNKFEIEYNEKYLFD
jgi:REP element-mobilizing transposase RayT